MNEIEELKKFVVDRSQLPKYFPTHRHASELWEHLGRVVATFGFLEEILRKAIFAITSTKKYTREEAEVVYDDWAYKMEKTLTDQLYNLAESYASVAKEGQLSGVTNEWVSDLVDDIKKASKIRNVLCHSSWGPPDTNGKSRPLFVNRSGDQFDTPVDIIFLQHVQVHATDLACSVIESITASGMQFPGSPI